MAATVLRRAFEHPLTRGFDLDDPRTTELRKKIIASKPFLRSIYDEWYSMLARELPPMSGAVVELGSGAGYCEKFITGVIKTELIPCLGVHLAADAQRLPFADESLRAVVFVNVFHHLSDVRKFLHEADRCLKKGGRMAMIEPWVTPWSLRVNTWLHHEPFLPRAKEWSFESLGPLSGANGALPWIVFERDRSKFEEEFPRLHLNRVTPFLPFRYILSGGVGMRSLMPGFTHPFWAVFEKLLSPFSGQLAMFALIVVSKG